MCLAQGKACGTQTDSEAAAGWSVILFAPASAPGASGQLWHTQEGERSNGGEVRDGGG